MPTDPATVAFKSDASVRILAHSVVVGTGTTNTSTFEASYVKLPPSSSPWLQQVFGVTALDFLDPNQFFAQGTDASTVNGVAWVSPYVGVGVGKPISCAVKGIVFCIAAGTVAEGDLALAADQYGRISNPANLSVASDTRVYPVGVIQKPAVINQLVEVLLSFNPTIVP